MTHELTTTSPDEPERDAPWLSIIVPTYGAEPYLDDFIASVEAQGGALAGVEVIAVDDGARDRSGEMLDGWAARRPDLVTVVHKENGGLSSARNAGLDVARGTWVTFPDPDDILADGYLAAVVAMVERSPDADAIATNIQFFREESGQVTNTHPLRYRFDRGDVVVDLDRFPDYFQLSAATCLLRRERVEELVLRFDPRVVPNFEDAHLIARYLLASDSPRLALVSSAHYHYRKRSARNSLVDTSASKPEKYTDLLRHGYLDLVERAVRATESVPAWLQSMVVYELNWILRADESMFGITAASVGVADEFHALMRAIVAYLDPERVEEYGITRMSASTRIALAHGFRDGRWQSKVFVDRIDTAERVVRLVYWYVGEGPREEVVAKGRRIELPTAKTRDVTYGGRTVLHERILWVPMSTTFEIHLDGARTELVRGYYGKTVRHVRAADLDRMFRNKPVFRHLAGRRKRTREKIADGWAGLFGARARERRHVRRVQKIAASRVVRRFFANAWVLMDRDYNSWDNAEHLFRYLRARDRSVNAWFVVRRGSPDWTRLRADGYRRLVPYGSFLWKLLVLNASFIVSSHADGYVYEPREMRRYGRLRWRFVFLQHGVIHNDISRWLNPKPIRLFVTTTLQEHGYIAGDGGPFVFGGREVVRTGLPRHDRLAAIASTTTRDAVVIMPTWRQFLLGEVVSSTNKKALLPDFLSTEYAVAWRAVLADPRLRAAARAKGLRLAFMPHPNLTPYLETWGLDPEIEVLSYASADVQEVLARAVTTVTDYSSVVFDGAAVRRPVVYFQFDREKVFGGGHLTRPGYFDYERDGFGPVTRTVDEAVEEIIRVIEADGRLAEPYATRVEETFGTLDGRNCERTAKAIKAVEKKMRWV